MKAKQKVFIKELKQVGTILTVNKDGKPETVAIETPEGTEKIINVLEKGYTILSGILQVIRLIVSLFTSRK